MNFGERIRRARETAGLTQEEAGARLGVSPKTVQKWEYGLAKPADAYWRGIVDAYGMSEDDFLSSLRSFIGEGRTDVRNLPEELFRKEDYEVLKDLSLTTEEQKILGIEEVYLRTYGSGFVPFEIVDRMTPFRFLSARRSLYEKVGRFRDFVVRTILESPNQGPFDARNLSNEKVSELLEDEKCGGKGWTLLKKLAMLESEGGEIPTRLFSGRTYRNETPYGKDAEFFTVEDDFVVSFDERSAGTERKWREAFPGYVETRDGTVRMTEAGERWLERYRKYLPKDETKGDRKNERKNEF